ncbi:MAG: hypothetical protein AB4368_03890 [Xenococcaceae cyanobacterium]
MITSKIVLLKSSEIDRASEILARAFDEDRMFRYLGIGEAEQALVNVNALKWFCKMGLRNCQPSAVRARVLRPYRRLGVGEL